MQKNESMTPFLFPFRQLEWLSAKKGKNIKIIQETSGANVYIDKEYEGSDENALCVILGKTEQVQIAKVMIKEKLNQYNQANTFPIIDSDGLQIMTTDHSDNGSAGSNYVNPNMGGNTRFNSPGYYQGAMSSPSSQMKTHQQLAPVPTKSSVPSPRFVAQPPCLNPPLRQQPPQSLQQQPSPTQNYFNFNADFDQNNNQSSPTSNSYQFQNYQGITQRAQPPMNEPKRLSRESGMNFGGSGEGFRSHYPSSLGLDKLTLNITSDSKSSNQNGSSGGWLGSPKSNAAMAAPHSSPYSSHIVQRGPSTVGTDHDYFASQPQKNTIHAYQQYWQQYD